MTPADHKLIEEALEKYHHQIGDSWLYHFREWIIDKLLEALAKVDLDLKVVRLKK